MGNNTCFSDFEVCFKTDCRSNGLINQLKSFFIGIKSSIFALLTILNTFHVKYLNGTMLV